jgi:hypothetical protein
MARSRSKRIPNWRLAVLLLALGVLVCWRLQAQANPSAAGSGAPTAAAPE